MKSGFLSRHFPPPQFLKPNYIGVSFSDTNIKAIIFEKNTAHPKIKSHILSLEKGSIVEGKILNPEDVKEKLSLIKQEFDTDFVYFALPDELTYIYTTKIRVVSKGSLEESVAFTIEENIPISLEDSVFDFIPVKIEKNENGFDVEVVVSACLSSEINKYIEILSQSGLEVVGAINESQAIAQALIKNNSKGTFFVVHAREERIGTYLVKDGVVHFSTVTNVSKGDYQEQFLNEYEKVIEYSAKYSLDLEDPIKSVLVCGEFGYAKKIIESTEKSPDLIQNLKFANVWANVLEIEKEIPSIKYEDSLNFAGPIGAVLSDIK